LAEIKNIIQQLQQNAAAIDRALSALREIEGQNSSASSSIARAGRVPMSADARKRIGEATRKRWAAKRAAKDPIKDASPVRPKGHLSPEGRQRIVEATKRRWAAKRAADAVAQGKGKKTAR
jgi:hypothetical protein